MSEDMREIAEVLRTSLSAPKKAVTDAGYGSWGNYQYLEDEDADDCCAASGR